MDNSALDLFPCVESPLTFSKYLYERFEVIVSSRYWIIKGFTILDSSSFYTLLHVVASRTTCGAVREFCTGNNEMIALLRLADDIYIIL